MYFTNYLPRVFKVLSYHAAAKRGEIDRLKVGLAISKGEHVLCLRLEPKYVELFVSHNHFNLEYTDDGVSFFFLKKNT